MALNSILDYQYAVENPTLDARMNRGNLTSGLLSKVTGVDGRYCGGIRRFPGFNKECQIIDGTTTYSNPIYFKAITMQKGNSQYILRGYLVAATPSTAAQVDLVFYYYDTQTAANALFVVASNISASSEIDATVSSKFCYIAIAGSTPKVMYWTTALVVKSMGVGDFEAPVLAATDVSVATSGGVLGYGRYLVAYRYFDSTRNLYSGLSDTYEVSTTSGYSAQKITIARSEINTGVGATNIKDFDKVAIYRTITVSVGDSAYAGGYLYLVNTVDITHGASTSTFSYAIGGTATDALTDLVLVQQTAINAADETGGTAPQSGVIGIYESVTFIGGVGSSEADQQLAQIQWSPTQVVSPENFPGNNTHRLPSTDEAILAFVPSSDFLFAFSSRSVYRIKRMGTQINISQIYLNRGLSSKYAVAFVDNALMFSSASGLMLLNASEGSLTQVAAVNRYYSTTWASTLSYIQIKYDASLGGVFVFNSSTKQVLIVWTTTNCITELEDANWKYITEGQRLSGGPNRVFCIDNNCTVFYPDSEGTASKATMGGLSGTVNGLITSTGTGTITDSTATFDTTLNGLKNLYVYILSGTSIGQKRAITSNTGTQITYSGTALTLSAGDRYAIAPVYFEVRYWPITAVIARSLFDRIILTSMGVCSSYVGGESTTAIQTIFVGAYRNLEETRTRALSEAPLLTDNPAESRVYVNMDGIVLEPCLIQIASDVKFEIASTLVVTKYTESKKGN